MPSVNWGIFEGLPGAVQSNFEMLCRGLVRRHYARHGDLPHSQPNRAWSFISSCIRVVLSGTPDDGMAGSAVGSISPEVEQSARHGAPRSQRRLRLLRERSPESQTGFCGPVGPSQKAIKSGSCG